MPHSEPILYPSTIIPRRRAVIVSRSRPLALLEQCLDHQLLLLVAPPGYGKTCLLVDFAHTTHRPVCWYTVDPYEQEPLRFLAHFVAAIALRFPGFGQATASALHSLHNLSACPDTLSQILSKELHEVVKERFVLILDDFHHLDEQPFSDHFLSRFLEHAGECCCLILASRRRPSLSAIDRLAAYDQVACLSESDLAFRGDEIQALALQNYQVQVDPQDAQALAKRTEGWITGLLLSNPAGWEKRAAQLLAVHGHAGNLERYWARLLEAQPEPVQTFLLHVALLDDFTPQLCAEALSPLYPHGADWPGLFECVMRYNLFVQAVDQNGGWLRLHCLFREYLHNRLKRERPAEYELLLRRLVQVYSASGEWEKAYTCQEHLGQIEQLAELIEQAGPDMIHNGRYEALQRWIEALPGELTCARPGLLSLKGLTASAGPEIVNALPLLDQAVELFNQRQDTIMLGRSLARRASVRHYLGKYQEAFEDARCLLIAAYNQPDMRELRAEAFCKCGINLRFLGWPRRAHRHLRKALDLYQSMGNPFSVASVQYNLGLVLRSLGCYQQAEHRYRQALDFWRSLPNSYRIADVLNDLGVLYHYRGDFRAAQAAFSEALELARSNGYTRIEGFLLCCFGSLYADLDAFAPAEAAFGAARRLAERIQHRYLAFYLDCAQAALARRRDDLETARLFLQSAGKLAECGKSDSERAAYLREVGLLLLAEDDLQPAADCFAQAAQLYAQHGWALEHALLELYHAKALDRLGQTQAARERLRQALEIRQRLDEPNCMLSEGRMLKALLQSQRSDTLAGRFLAQVEAFEKQLPSTRRELLRQAVVECAPVQPRLQIVALGKAQLEVDGRPICDGEWKKNSHRELFFYMLTQSSSLTRRELANLFFPHLEIERQNASLRNAIYHLSRLLGEEAIMREEERLAFNRQIDYVYDVERFLEGLAKARRVAEPREKLELYNETSEIYGGVYLPNIAGSWVMPEREYLRQGYLEAMLQSGEIYLSLHEHGLALERVYRLLKQEPCLEPAHCLAMRIHAARGSRVDVIRQYQLCERSMAEQLNIQLASRTREIYLELTR